MLSASWSSKSQTKRLSDSPLGSEGNFQEEFNSAPVPIRPEHSLFVCVAEISNDPICRGRAKQRGPFLVHIQRHPFGSASSQISKPTFGVRASGSWFMEFDNVAIGIADEKEDGAAKLHRFCYSDTKIIELSFDRLHVTYL